MRCEVRGRAQLFDGAEDARGAGMAGVERRVVGLKRGDAMERRWKASKARGGEVKCAESNCSRP